MGRPVRRQVGDSLAVGTRPYLGRDLGGWRVGTSASISKNAQQGAAEPARRHLPPVVVASLGTNDDPHAVARLAAKRDNVHVVDWVAMAAHNRAWFGPDGVHPNATGYMARARAIAKQARRCRRSLVE